MQIIDMHTLNETQLVQAARLLSDELPIGWPAPSEAMDEIRLRLDEAGNVYLAAVEGDAVIGFCGVLPQYDGHVFELHPLVVRHDWQRKGVGTALVSEIARIARERGGLTLWLGADDEKPGGETSLANADLYDDLPGKFRDFAPGTHQSAFYLKLGFKIVGVMPDANGEGKPDICMAKRL